MFASQLTANRCCQTSILNCLWKSWHVQSIIMIHVVMKASLRLEWVVGLGGWVGRLRGEFTIPKPGLSLPKWYSVVTICCPSHKLRTTSLVFSIYNVCLLYGLGLQDYWTLYWPAYWSVLGEDISWLQKTAEAVPVYQGRNIHNNNKGTAEMCGNIFRQQM